MMLKLLRNLSLAVLCLPWGVDAQTARVETPEIALTLVSERSEFAPGERAMLGVLLEHAEHWHTYWRNPGDSGLPTKLRFTLPEGYRAGEIEWPHPQRFDLAGIINYGFDGRVLLPVPLEIPADASGEVRVAVQVDYLVCREECIPGRADLALTRPIGTGAIDATVAADFVAARARIPAGDLLAADWQLGEREVRVSVMPPAGFDASRGWSLYPIHTEIMSNAAAAPAQSDGQLVWQVPRSEYFQSAPATLDLVLVNGEPPQSRAWPVRATLQPGAPAAVAPAAPAPAVTDSLSFGLALLFALLGGMVLNLMPCVFPVLTLKALALRGDRHGLRHGVLYALGCVVAFLSLAGLLLALRAGGAALGWGFQLQSPWLTGALTYLFFAMGLSLSGVFSFGERWMGVGQTLTDGESDRAAFFTGVLAAVVASPCTAPFMGAAMGYALTQSVPSALAVFAALGLGLALPFLLLCVVPGLTRYLPRPGVWMDRLKQFLAFPLYLSAIWLLWVYGEQQGALAMAHLLAGAVFLALALWLLGLPERMRTLRALTIVAALGGTGYALVQGANGPSAAAAIASAEHEAYTEARLAELTSSGKPVLVNMTAAWCITCLANERVALSTEAVRTRLREAGITYVKGDWTRRDDAITRYLAQFGRTGVPLYVLYPGGGRPPQVLPQLLTESSVLAALDQVQPAQAAGAR